MTESFDGVMDVEVSDLPTRYPGSAICQSHQGVLIDPLIARTEFDPWTLGHPYSPVTSQQLPDISRDV